MTGGGMTGRRAAGVGVSGGLGEAADAGQGGGADQGEGDAEGADDGDGSGRAGGVGKGADGEAGYYQEAAVKALKAGEAAAESVGGEGLDEGTAGGAEDGLAECHQGDDEEGEGHPAGEGEEEAGYGAGDGGAQDDLALAKDEPEGRHKEGGQEAAHAGDGQEVAADIGAAAEDFGGEDGEQEPGGMEDDVGDYGEEHHLEDGALAAPDVAEAFEHIGEGTAALAGCAGAVVGRPHRPEHQNIGEVEGGFDGEVPEEAEGEDEDAADEGAEDAGAGDGQDIGGEGVAKHLTGDGGGDEGLAHRLGYGVTDAGEDDIEVGVPDEDASRKDEEGEGEGEGGHRQLEDDDEAAAVEAVAEYAAPGSGDEAGEGVDAADGDDEESGDGGAFGEVADEPADAEQLEPLGAVGEEVAAPEESVVGAGEPGVQGVQAREFGEAEDGGSGPGGDRGGCWRRDGLPLIKAVQPAATGAAGRVYRLGRAPGARWIPVRRGTR